MSHHYDTDVDPDDRALDAKDTGTMNATTTQPMPAPPVNPGPRVRCLIAIADTSLSAFEKLRLSEEAIAAKPPRANLPYVRALVKYLGQIAVAEADDQVRKIDAMLSSSAR